MEPTFRKATAADSDLVADLVFGEADLAAMRRLRDAFNPDGVCNPSKIFPTTRFCAESDPKARGYDRVPLAE